MIDQGFAALLLCLVPPAPAGSPPIQTLLPADTLAVLWCEDVPRFRELFAQEPWGRLLADPDCAPFVEELRGAWEQTGIDVSRVSRAFVALTHVNVTDRDFGFVVGAVAEEGAVDARERPPLDERFALGDYGVRAASSRCRAELEACSAGSTASLAEDQDFVEAMAWLDVDPSLPRLFVDLEALHRILPADVLAETFPAFASLELRAFAAGLRWHEGAFHSHAFLMDTDGSFARFSPDAPLDFDALPFVPANCASMQFFHVDPAVASDSRVLDLLGRFVDFGPEEAAVANGWLSVASVDGVPASAEDLLDSDVFRVPFEALTPSDVPIVGVAYADVAACVRRFEQTEWMPPGVLGTIDFDLLPLDLLDRFLTPSVAVSRRVDGGVLFERRGPLGADLTGVGAGVAFSAAGETIGRIALRVRPRSARVAVVVAKAELGALSQAVISYQSNHDRLPQSLDVLLQPDPENFDMSYIDMDRIPLDPWGNPYEYVVARDGKTFTVRSLGADGKPGGKREDADIDSNTMFQR